MPLLVVGCTVVDIIFARVKRLPAWPEHTEFTPANLTFLREPPLITIGGNGANAAFVAARCGATVTLRSNVGDDWLGDRARAWLHAAGCVVAGNRRSSRTALNVTAADAKFRRATFFYPGSSSKLPMEARGFSHALICGWPHPPLTELARRLRAWRARGIFTALDVGPILDAAPTLAQLRATLTSLDLFLANEHEIQAITRATSLAPALARLRRVFSGHVVIKRGAKGSWWAAANTNSFQLFPGRLVRAYNTVGAGDTFNGALLAALERGATFPAALKYANQAAASVVRSSRGALGVKPPSKR